MKHRDPKAVDFVAALRRRGRVTPILQERDEFNVTHCRNLGKINYPRTKAERAPERPKPRRAYKRKTDA